MQKTTIEVANFHIKAVITYTASPLECCSRGFVSLLNAATSAIKFPPLSKWPQSFKKYVCLRNEQLPQLTARI